MLLCPPYALTQSAAERACILWIILPYCHEPIKPLAMGLYILAESFMPFYVYCIYVVGTAL